MLRRFTTYAFAQIFIRGLAFVIFPVLSRYLSPESYGNVAFFMALKGLLPPVLFLNLTYLPKRNFFDHDRDEVAWQRGVIWSTALVWTLILSAGTFAGRGWLSEWIGLPTGLILLLPLLSLLSIMVTDIQVLVRNLERPLTYAGLIGLRAIIEYGGALLLVIALSMDWQGRVYAYILSVVGLFPLAFWVVRKVRYIRLPKWDPAAIKAFLRQALRVSWPLVPNALSLILLESADRLMIGKILGQYELGIYNAAYSYAALLMALMFILRNTFSPSLLRNYIHQNTENLRKVVLISYLNVALALLFGAALALASPLWFDYILDERYQPALAYAPWLIGGLMFLLLEHLFAAGLNARKDTRVIGLIGILAALLNVGLNLLLLPSYGITGAVAATFVSYALKTLAYFLYVQRHYPLPWLQVRLSWAEVRKQLRK